jgi:aryl-alcohol dehydrogenase-like predicted oxidoreductase
VVIAMQQTIETPHQDRGMTMEYVNLGNTGLKVSYLTLGCMSFGAADRGPHEWTLGEDESRDIVKQALDAGITTFDTANMYSAGSSEEILGRALADFASRGDRGQACCLTCRGGPVLGGLTHDVPPSWVSPSPLI